MADFTKCVNANCPLNHICYRFTVTSSGIYQSYSLFKPKQKTDGIGYYCDYFKTIPNSDVNSLQKK